MGIKEFGKLNFSHLHSWHNLDVMIKDFECREIFGTLKIALRSCLNFTHTVRTLNPAPNDCFYLFFQACNSDQYAAVPRKDMVRMLKQKGQSNHTASWEKGHFQSPPFVIESNN